jgi:hypothetical protein
MHLPQYTGVPTGCSSKPFLFSGSRTPRVSGGPRWAAGKETSARDYHPLRAAQRSRATAKALALLGGLRSGANESGVKRALVEPHEWPYGRGGWAYHLGGSFV